jgi:transposase
MTRYGLRDDQWQRIKDVLLGKVGDVGATARDNRRFVEAVLYRYRVQPVGQEGVWQRRFEHLATDADNEYAIIDSTIVRAHQHRAGAPKKR